MSHIRIRLALILLVASWTLLPADISAAEQPKVGQRWALLIGVDDYANANDLNYCGADQRALHQRLRASGFPEEQIFLMHDKAEENRYRPSQRNIEKQLDVVLSLASEDDLLVIAFSGHGVSLGGKSYLCPNDATLDDPKTLVALDGLYDRLRDCAATFKLVLVDACRNDPRLGGARSLTATDETKALARSFQETRLPEGVVLLNSCAPGEVSYEEPKLGHGVFMHYVLEGLAGSADKDADGAVSLYELQSYAGLKTRTHVARQFNESQRPFYKIEGEGTAMEYALLPVQSNTTTSEKKIPPAVEAFSKLVANVASQKYTKESKYNETALYALGELVFAVSDEDIDALEKLFEDLKKLQLTAAQSEEVAQLQEVVDLRSFLNGAYKIKVDDKAKGEARDASVVAAIMELIDKLNAAFPQSDNQDIENGLMVNFVRLKAKIATAHNDLIKLLGASGEVAAANLIAARINALSSRLDMARLAMRAGDRTLPDSLSPVVVLVRNPGSARLRIETVDAVGVLKELDVPPHGEVFFLYARELKYTKHYEEPRVVGVVKLDRALVLTFKYVFRTKAPLYSWDVDIEPSVELNPFAGH